MEKRLLIAVVLSFLVLSLWSAIMPKSKRLPPKQQAEESQVFENKQLTQQTLISNTPPSVTQTIIPTVDQVESKEETQFTETETLLSEFSNLGGNLKSVTVLEYNHKLPITNYVNIAGYETIPFNLVESARNFISYSYQDDQVKIVKRYHLSDNDYIINSEVEITNISEMSKMIEFSIDAFKIDLNRLDKNLSQRSAMLTEYSISHNGVIFRKRNVRKFKDKESVETKEAVNWVGYRDQYFCSIVLPEYDTTEYYVNPLDEKSAVLGVKGAEIRLSSGNKTVLKSTIYVGPQEISILKRYGKNFESIINFKAGGFVDIMAFGMTDKIARIMLMLLNFLHRIIPNWGVSIILFAICIYGITYPLTAKSMRSMKRMQALQPQLTALKAKHKNNQQKMSQEMMVLYKENKVNPLGGCLPIFFQMPVFISLYQLLWRTYSFKGASFLWIKDLSEPDRMFTLPFSLPYFGNEFNFLPLLYAVLMFAQTKLQAKNMAGGDPSQAEMQKMMSRIMPFMLGLLFYKFASGLTLYFTVYFTLTTLTQLKMSKAVKVE